MTTVSQIITDAFRQSNLLALGSTPTTNQQDEALRYVNRIVLSVLGNEAGELLEPFALGGGNIEAPTGFPWYQQAPWGDWYLPMNKRVMLNLTAAATIPLHPQPSDGARFGISDPSDNLATYNLTIVGNGRTIEDDLQLLINTSGINREWFYRQDLGDWMRVTDLALVDNFPFPSEFDQMFITMLAMSLNPAYGATIDNQLSMLYSRSRTQFRARYHNSIDVRSEDGLLRMSRTTENSKYWNYGYWDNPDVAFDRGYPW
jgi:hypothetical protein